jgi:prepilin-type N-terminal cleavage/methylation domain-containing protein
VSETNRHCERGVSLVEVVVTMALMSILMTAFAATIKDGAAVSRLEGNARDLLTQLQLARQVAITEAKNCMVTVDSANGTFVVWVDYNGNSVLDDPPAPGNPPEVKASGALEKQVEFSFAAGVTAPPTANTPGVIADAAVAAGLMFDSRGRCFDLPGGVLPGGGQPKEIYLYKQPPADDAADWQMVGVTVRAATGNPRLWHLKKGTNDQWS